MKLSDLKAICEGATPGPWGIWISDEGSVAVESHEGAMICAVVKGGQTKDNSAYIAQFNPEFVMKLLVCVEKASELTVWDSESTREEFKQALADLGLD